MKLLLLSNSTQHGRGYLDHAEGAIRELFSGARRIVFVPFALADLAAYTARVRARFEPWGIEVEGLQADEADRRRLERAEGVFVGGGNTFRLLARLQRGRLLAPLREQVLAGMPYLGSSAGTNVACPGIYTTNDMPVVEPESFEALGLVPFQINPHYLDPDPNSTHMGETREERIAQFLEERGGPVVGLREGSWLERRGAQLRLGGFAGARIFRRGRAAEERAAGATLEDLLGPAAG